MPLWPTGGGGTAMSSITLPTCHATISKLRVNQQLEPEWLWIDGTPARPRNPTSRGASGVKERALSQNGYGSYIYIYTSYYHIILLDSIIKLILYYYIIT